MVNGMIIPAGGGNPEKRVMSAGELVAMGYTAISEQALKDAFGENGYAEFLTALTQAKLSKAWDGNIRNYPAGDSVAAY